MIFLTSLAAFSVSMTDMVYVLRTGKPGTKYDVGYDVGALDISASRPS
jgi:hypothetical protein